MKLTFPIGLLAFFILAGCNKDKFQTSPHIEIKSVSGEILAKGSDLSVDLQITDKEGDVKDSVFVIRERLNQTAPSPRTLVLKYKIPSFPDNSKIDMEVTLANAQALTLQSSAIRIPGTQNNQPDTLNLKFVVRDNAGNLSDTASKQIVVIR